MRIRLLNPNRLLIALALAMIGSQCIGQTVSTAETLTPAAKTQVITTLVKELTDNYVFPKSANRAAESVLTHLQAHDYDAITSGDEFAKLLTAHLQAVCKDVHLRVFYTPGALPARQVSNVPTDDEVRRLHNYEREHNGGVEKVQRLDGNVGYIEIRSFLEPTAAAEPIRAAMDFVADTDALIVDLRRNGGGSPETVCLFLSYLFGDKPVHINDIYYRQGNRTIEYWTQRHVPGHRYLNRDVYVLTSKHTASGAEECSYDLQTLKRATIVGDPTWGGANPGERFRLTRHFSAFIPGGSEINPYTHTNWEGVGVKPDIVMPAEDAMQAVHILAIKCLLAKATTLERRASLTSALKQVEADTPDAAGHTASN
jgi:hypothetical protein